MARVVRGYVAVRARHSDTGRQWERCLLGLYMNVWDWMGTHGGLTKLLRCVLGRG